MKKTIKAFILIFTFMICVSLIGGAYALYVVNADQLEISFSAEPIISWEPEVGGYYIVGEQLGGWSVNENSIKMTTLPQGSGNLAEWYGTIPAGTQFKCVRYNGVGDITWYDLAYEPNYGPAKVDKYGDGEGGVTASNGNLVAPTSGELIYVCINTENGKNYSWGQTAASMS